MTDRTDDNLERLIPKDRQEAIETALQRAGEEPSLSSKERERIADKIRKRSDD